MIAIREAAHATEELLYSYIICLFFPALQANKQLPGCLDMLVILFDGNCSDQLLKEFAERGVVIITYPPHTSNRFQVLDILLFGQLKSTTKSISRKDSDPAGIDHPVRISKAHRLVSTSTIARASWTKAGSDDGKRDEVLLMGRSEVCRSSLRLGGCSQELWAGRRVERERVMNR
jgi:hypothetical protein